jgi:hypothetical protein
LYRLVFYNKISGGNAVHVSSAVKKKSALPLQQIIDTMTLLNNSINVLDRNPNRLLLLFNVLTKLP